MEKQETKYKKQIKFYRILFFVALIAQLLSLIFSIFCFTLFLSLGWGIGLLILLVVFMILTYVIFARYTNLYPLNDIKQYASIPTNALIDKGNGKYELNLANDGNGEWIITNAKESFILNLRGYLFPKAYILSFFIRQFSYPVINRKKLRLKCLGESIYVGEKYKEINVIIHTTRKKTYKIVKNGKTALKIYRGFINLTPFYMDAIENYNNRLRYYMNINEQIYFHEKHRK